jgi:hypothetical protein
MPEDNGGKELADEIVRIVVLGIGLAIALAAFVDQIATHLGRLG